MGQLNARIRQQRLRGAREIYRELKAQIEGGIYKPGAEIPSTRALAAEFGASRTTVTAAYDQLLAEGFIETHQGRRARVSAALPADAARRVVGNEPALRPIRLSAFGRRLARLAAPAVAGVPLPIDFRYGDIAAADFPHAIWRRSLTKALAASTRRNLRYQAPEGSRELAEALQAYLWRARGLRCDADQIVIVNGSQQGLDLCARLLLDAGDLFVIENPSYWAARNAFESTGARPIIISVDAEGLQTENLAGLKGARLCYVTPSHQFPLGHVLSASRRDQLLRWAARASAYLLEDDYDSEYRYDIRPIPPLQAADGAGRVIYLGTVSKTLSPLLRLGYLVVPHELVDAFRASKRLADRHTPALEQLALADFLQTGAYERHVRRLRRRNAQRREELLEALDRHFGDTIEIQGAAAGLHVVVWFKMLDPVQEGDFAEISKKQGVGIYPISNLYAEQRSAAGRRAGFVFGYAALDEAEIRKGISRLAHSMRCL